MVDAPASPRSMEETGLDSGFLLDLLIKNIYRLAHERPSEMAAEMRLAGSIVDELIAMGREARLLQTLGARSASVSAEMRYELTDSGRAWALDVLRQSEYVGPAPVPLKQFYAQVKRQTIRGETITRDGLTSVMKDLILSKGIAQLVGPAANSAASMLLYVALWSARQRQDLHRLCDLRRVP